MLAFTQCRRPFRVQVRIGFASASFLHAPEPVAIEPAERPDRGTANERRRIIEKPLGFGSETRIAGIADRDQHITDKTRTADTLDRAFGEQRAERGIVEPDEFGKLQRAQHLARGEFYFAACDCKFVPWANREAIVAAIDAIADQRTQFARGENCAEKQPGAELA